MEKDDSKRADEAIIRALLGLAPTDEQYKHIGQFFHEFSQVEFSLRFVLSRLMNLPSDYFDIVTAPYDTNALCNVVRAFAKKACSAEYADPLIEVVKKFQKLNEERVRIAHGTWTDGDQGLTSRHVSRTSLEPAWHYGGAGEIEKLIDVALALQQDLLVAGVGAISNANATWMQQGTR